MIRFPVRAVTLACLLAAFPAAETAAGPATDQLKGAVEGVVKVLGEPGAREVDRRVAVRKIANDIFDFVELARRALGRHWQPLTDAQREEFTALFSDLIERSYIAKLELYGGERIAYASERVDGDVATVATRIITKNRTEVPIDYRLLRKGDRWLVYDVSIEGVSLVASYRTQFNKIIQTASYTELVQKLKAKQDELAAEANGKKAAPSSP